MLLPGVMPLASAQKAPIRRAVVRHSDVFIGGGISAAITALYNSFAPGTRLSGSLKWKTIQQNDFGILLILIAVQTDQHHTCRFKPKTPSC